MLEQLVCGKYRVVAREPGPSSYATGKCTAAELQTGRDELLNELPMTRRFWS